MFKFYLYAHLENHLTNMNVKRSFSHHLYFCFIEIVCLLYIQVTWYTFHTLKGKTFMMLNIKKIYKLCFIFSFLECIE